MSESSDDETKPGLNIVGNPNFPFETPTSPDGSKEPFSSDRWEIEKKEDDDLQGAYMREIVRNAARAASEKTVNKVFSELMGARRACEKLVEDQRNAELARVRSEHRQKLANDAFYTQIKEDTRRIHDRLDDGERRFQQIETMLRKTIEQQSKMLEIVTALHLSRVSTIPATGRLTSTEVLVVEDDPLVSYTVRRVLESEGARVTVADTINRAEELLQTSPHAVVVDLLLQDDDGMVIVREIKLGFPEIGVVIATGNASTTALLEARELGVRVLEKPYDAEDLIVAVVEARDGRAPFAT